VYLMYAMYFKQPCLPRVKFRLRLEEFRDMWKLMEEAKRDQHYDVLYAWNKVRGVSGTMVPCDASAKVFGALITNFLKSFFLLGIHYE